MKWLSLLLWVLCLSTPVVGQTVSQPPEKLRLIPRFDLNGDQSLDPSERRKARAYVKNRRGSRVIFAPLEVSGEPTLDAREEKPAGGVGLYDLGAVRTFYLEFANSDWESELADFYRTDVMPPAQLMVSRKVYSQVGVGFRGGESFLRTRQGEKRSLNIDVDYYEQDMGETRSAREDRESQ
ncbi:MAG: hypothetical protein AAF514_09590, partial [Verrucomicrobiota bacterium]